MKALIWKNKELNQIELIEKTQPQIIEDRDAIVKVKFSSICTSDIHIKNGYVPFAKEGVVLGHEFVGEVVGLGKAITNLDIGDRVSGNCETFCGECYFCQRGYINNCENGGWHLGCKIDGAHAQYVRVPFADCGLTKIPDNLTYENALFVGDILSSGYFGAELCEIKQGDVVAIIGAGPVGLCAMQCAKLLGAQAIVAIDINQRRLDLVKKLNLADYVFNPDVSDVEKEIKNITCSRGVDAVIECAGGENTFELAWKIARANAIVALVGMYEKSQILPLPSMYGKNLIFKTGGVDAVHCQKLLEFISQNKLNTDFLITQTIDFEDILDGYNLFEFKDKENPCLKIAIKY